MLHHQPPTTRSQGREETGNSTKRVSEAVSKSWNNMDILLISDALRHMNVRKFDLLF